MKNVVCQNFKVVTLLIIIFGRYLHVNFGLSPCENFDSFLRPCKIRDQQCTIVKKILTCNRNSEFLQGRSCFSIFPSLILELCVPCYRWLEPRLQNREWKKNAVVFDDGELMGIPIKRSTASFQVLLMSSETGLRREKFNLRDNRKLLRIIPNLPEP